MDLTAWLAVGVFALLVSGSALLTDIDEVWVGLPAVFAWVIVGLGATNLEVCNGPACHVTESYISVALLAGGMAVVMFLVTLRGATAMLHPSKEPEEAFANE